MTLDGKLNHDRTPGAKIGKAEGRVSEIASGLLKMDPKKLDARTNLGDFGFDSITLKIFADKLSEAFGMDVSPTIFFAHGDIRSLGVYFEKAAESGEDNSWDTQEPIRPDRAREGSAAEKSHAAGKPSRSALSPLARKGSATDASQAAGPLAAGPRAGKESIAIVGAAGMFPGSRNLREFWKHLEAGTDLVVETPPERWDWRKGSDGNPDPQLKWGGFLPEVDKFDPRFFNISRLEAEMMDPQHRMFLETVWKALEDAGYKASELAGRPIGVFAGVQFSDYQQLLAAGSAIKAQQITGNSHSILANRVSYLLDFRGPSEAIDTACSSGMMAVNRAVKAIQSGECEWAVAGGVSLILSPSNVVSAGKLGILSPEGRCRTFDKDANGYVKGEGVGAFLLKPLAAALRDGDNLYAVIKAVAVNHGGKSTSLTAPNSEAQAALVVSAFREAGISSDTVTFMETHGTGTQLGDPVEIEGLKSAFRQLAGQGVGKSRAVAHCSLGSVKSQIGHLEPAAGIAGIAKVILAMRHRVLPGNLNMRELNPYIKLEGTAFRVAGKTRAWNTPEGADGQPFPRRAGVSCFGFGGANGHILLEEPDAEFSKRAAVRAGPRLVVLSARSADRLRAYAVELVEFLRERKSEAGAEAEAGFLMDLAYTLHVGREVMDERLAVTAGSPEELADKLIGYIASSPRQAVPGVYSGNAKNGIGTDLLLGGKAGAEFLRITLEEGDLGKLAQLWAGGLEIDWKPLYMGLEPRRISLPTYPFARERYWLPVSDAPVPETAPMANREPFPPSMHASALMQKPIPTQMPMTAVPAERGATSVGSNRLESVVAGIVAAHLKIPPDDLDAQASFTEMGVDSVIGVEIINLINRSLVIELVPTALFNYPCVSDLAGFIGKSFAPALPAPEGATEALSEKRDAPETSQQREAPVTVSAPQSGPATGPRVDQERRDIAVIGVSGKFADARNLDEFWDNLKLGRDCVSEVPPERWDIREHFDPQPNKANKTYSKWAGLLDDVDKFDPLFFDIMPMEAKFMDPQQRLFLEESWKAFEDAGYSREDLSGSKCGVFLGAVYGDYVKVLESTNPVLNAFAMLGNHTAVMPARISYLLNLKGPSVVLDTACSSSLVSVHQACQSIRSGECDTALAGGIYLALTPMAHILSSSGGMLSPEGKCKTFDDSADGLAIGEGVGVVMLKPLDRALEDGDRIYAVIKGSGTNQDGKTNGITAPNALSQTELELDVYRKAGVNPETISYVETHGTGTKLGDPVELEGLTGAFREYTAKKQFCAIGSLKPNIGHTYQAAGIASLIKVLLCLKHRQIPPSIHYANPNRHIPFAQSPFFVNTKLRDWRSEDGSPLRAAISSFGYSGTNAHMVVEEFIAPARNPDAESVPCVIPISAKTPERLEVYVRNLLEHLLRTEAGETVPPTLEEIAYTMQIGRSRFANRLAIVAESRRDLAVKLAAFAEGETAGRQVFSGKADPKRSRSAAVSPDLDPGEAARLWTEGAPVDWKVRYGKTKPRKVSLPTYPFERLRCWITPAPQTPRAPSETFRDALRPLAAAGTAQTTLRPLTSGEAVKPDARVLREALRPGLAQLADATRFF